MRFGLKNAPATLQRIIGIISFSIKWQFTLVFLNDIVIFSRTWLQHIDHTRLALSLLKEIGDTLKFKSARSSLTSLIALDIYSYQVNLKSETTPLTLYGTFRYPKNKLKNVRSLVCATSSVDIFKITLASRACWQRDCASRWRKLGQFKEKKLTALETTQEEHVFPPILTWRRKKRTICPPHWRVCKPNMVCAATNGGKQYRRTN